MSLIFSRQRFAAALVAALVLAPVLGGCHQQAKAPPATPVPQHDDSPEGRLGRVMDKLKFALHTASNTAAGVKSERKCSYRLIPPSDKEPRPTAEVSVETRVALTATPEPPAKPGAPAAGATDKAAEPTPLPTPPPPKVDTEKVLLVYDNDKWTMPTKPSTETLQLCFEAALQDN